MPLLRKIWRNTYSYVIALPKDWVECYERKTGNKLEHVEVSVNGDLTIRPYVEKDRTKKETN